MKVVSHELRINVEEGKDEGLIKLSYLGNEMIYISTNVFTEGLTDRDEDVKCLMIPRFELEKFIQLINGK